MKKTLPAVITHIVLVLVLVIGMGVLGILSNNIDAVGKEKFTGELEHNV